MFNVQESICSFVEKYLKQRMKHLCFPDRLTFNHNVMFSNELNESLLPSLSLTSNIYCWQRLKYQAGGGLEEYRTLQCDLARETEYGHSSTRP